MRILVSSAGKINGGTRGNVLAFSLNGDLLGEFAPGSGIDDPRGLRVNGDRSLIYVNNGDNRVLAFDQAGVLQKASPPVDGLNPGGGNWGPDGRLYVGSRGRCNVVSFDAELAGEATEFLPPHILPFPRGFAFHPNQRFYFASGIGPHGEGDNTINVFSPRGELLNPGMTDDSALSPLDLTMSPDGHIVVSSEFPFNQPGAVNTLREFDAGSGELLRTFHFPDDPAFAQPRGLRFGPDGHLYCVCAHALVKFDFVQGHFLGAVVMIEHLHGQAIEFF